MAHTFNTLPEAVATAQALGLERFWRLHFIDTVSTQRRARGGPWEAPAVRFYLSLEDLIADLRSRCLAVDIDRSQIETLWTDQVSGSVNAR